MGGEIETRSARSVTCIVVPCYNESARLSQGEFLEFVRSHKEVCFLFVNDGSKDDTLQMLHDLCARNESRLAVLDLPRNQGKAEAVRQGMLHAMRELSPRFVGFWDADLATPLDAIPDFLRKLERHRGLDMVFGSRVRLLGHHVIRKMSRHYLGRLFATVVSVTLSLPVYDTQCGAKIFRVSPEFSGILAEPFLSRWIFDVEIIARVIQLHHGDRKRVEDVIYELPLMRWADIAGSKVHPLDFFRAMGEVYAIRKKYL
jgi:glycosyltransferase involved in cell wall biosynthesis